MNLIKAQISNELKWDKINMFLSFCFNFFHLSRQLLPYEAERSEPKLNDDMFENKLNDGTPIFIYFHGVTSHRAVDYRVEVYKLISRLGYHILTIDYRG